MSKKPERTFVQLLKASPLFDYHHELAGLVKEHGEGLPLLLALLEQKFITKDEGCRLYAESLGYAYVDPFASIITDEAIAAVPAEIARKANVIGLYVINGVLTTAMSKPDDEALVRRVGQIAQMPASPVFALPREIEDAILIQYSNEKNIEDSLGELERSTLFDNPDLACMGALLARSACAALL